MFGAI